MDVGRGWPWKLQVKQKRKKTEQQISDKINASAPAPAPAPALEFRQDIRLLEEGSSAKSSVSDVRQRDANSKMEAFVEQLAAKDELIAQHSKLAEDAVLGWEKAQSESTEMKQKLEAAEERASKLEEALKECMKRMRNVRGQAELEMAMRRAAEWERACGEKQSEAETLRSQVMEAEAEKAAMKKVVQERGRAMKEAVDARNRATEELRAKLDMAEKEEQMMMNRYEQLHVLCKAVEMRNEELRRRSHKQQIENLKKIATLESECHRLRLLLSKKQQLLLLLPPPAAIAHDQQQQIMKKKKKTKTMMELDVDSLNLPPPELLYSTPSVTHPRLRRRGAAQQLSLDGSSSSWKLPADLQKVNRDNANMNAAQSWASALISELAPFGNQQKVCGCDNVSSSDVVGIETSASCSGRELMDDFAEMEKLASIISEFDHCNASASADRDLGAASNARQTDSYKLCSASGFDEMAELKRMRQQEEAARRRLIDTERKLVASPVMNGALDGIRAALMEMGDDGETDVDLEVRDTKAWSLCGDHISISSSGRQSEDIWIDGGGGVCSKAAAPPADVAAAAATTLSSSNRRRRRRRRKEAETSSSEVDVLHDLAAAMRKVVHLLESFHSHFTDDAFLTHRRNSSQFQSCLRCIIALCHSSLPHDHHNAQTKVVDVDAIDFLAEMASALDWLLNFLFASSEYEDAAAAAADSNISRESRGYAIAADLDEDGEGTRMALSSTRGGGKFESLVKALTQLKSEKEASEAALREEMASLESRLEASMRKAAELEYRLCSAAAKDELEAQLRDAKVEIQRLKETEMRMRMRLQEEFRRRKDDVVDVESSPTTMMCRDLRHLQQQQQRWNPSTSTMREDDLEGEEENPPAQSSMALQVRDFDSAAEKVDAERQQTIRTIDKKQTDPGAEAGGGETAAAAEDYRRLSPYNRSPWNDHRSYSSIDQLPHFNEYYDDESNSNSPLMLMTTMRRRQGGASASYGGEEEEGNQARLMTFSPEAEMGRAGAATMYGGRGGSKEGGVARLRFPFRSPGRSPGRFLSLKAWETPEPSSSSPSPPTTTTTTTTGGGKQGKGGLSRFFFPKSTKTKATP